MPKSDAIADKPPIVRLVDGDGNPRDFWPTLPTREECVAAGFPVDFESFERLTRIWPVLTIEEKEYLGFSRKTRAMHIERLIADARQRQEKKP